MNCIASSATRRRIHGLHAKPVRLGIALLPLLALSTACNAPASESRIADEQLVYRILYTIHPNPAEGTVDVSMQLTQSRRLLREVRFHADQRISGIYADGELEIESGSVTWRPTKSGGSLRWTVAVAHRRNDAGYDAWLGPDWGILRAEDMLPRVSSRTLKGAESHTRMRFELQRSRPVFLFKSGQISAQDYEGSLEECPTGFARSDARRRPAFFSTLPARCRM